MLGGPGAEREVSLRSGAAVARALRSLGHMVQEVDPQSRVWTLPAGTEVVFLALHGIYGEDGGVQRDLEALGVPYTGCGPDASAISFDKMASKRRFLKNGVPTPKCFVISDARAEWPQGWQLPVVVKPVRQGSSVGLRFVDDARQWEPSLAEALRYDSEALIEERITGRETTVGILDGKPLPVVEVRPKGGVYDYNNKYTAGANEYLCPAPFEPGVTASIQAAGLAAFYAVGARDYARIDVMVTPRGQPMVLEVNTLPGMTETSLLPKAAQAAGIGYAELCQRMVDLALNHPAKTKESPSHANLA